MGRTTTSLPPTLVLLGAVVLTACTTNRNPVGDSILPELNVGGIASGPNELEMFIEAGNDRQHVGSYSASLSRTGSDRAVFVQVTDSPGGAIVDSVWVRASTLMPQRQRSYTPQGTLTLVFSERAVDVIRNIGGKQPERLREQVSQPVFAASTFTLVVRSLPLHAGFRARLPIYGEGDGPGFGTVEVVGSVDLPIGGRRIDAWIVEVTLFGRAATLWIERGGRHRELRAASILPDGRRFVQEISRAGA